MEVIPAGRVEVTEVLDSICGSIAEDTFVLL